MSSISVSNNKCVGAVPQLPANGFAGLASVPAGPPSPIQPAFAVESFMPQVATGVTPIEQAEGLIGGYEFAHSTVTFVQEQPSQQPFVLIGGTLQVPAHAHSPTRVVIAWVADRLPDLADLVQADSAGSAALFFSQTYPACMCFLSQSRTSSCSY